MTKYKKERLHPESYRTLRQLVKLHGTMQIIAAVYKIAEEMAHESLVAKTQELRK